MHDAWRDAADEMRRNKRNGIALGAPVFYERAVEAGMLLLNRVRPA
jgi:hypothetical protein